MNLIPITYSCGHKGVIEGSLDPQKREAQIKFYETKGSCPDCYAKTIAERDAANKAGCLVTLVSDNEYKENYSNFKFTKVGIKEPNKRYVFIPYSHIAAEGILEVLNIAKDNPNYKEYYNNIIATCLDRSTNEAKSRIIASDFSHEKKQRIMAAYELIDGYQEHIKASV